MEPVLRYVHDKYRKRPASALSVANDLKDWWTYLRAHETPWDAIDETDIRYYADIMEQTVSPLTHERYKRKTIRKRIGSVRNFYAWASAKGILDCSVDLSTTDYSSNSEQPGVRAKVRDAGTLMPGATSGEDDHVLALSHQDVFAVFAELGPLPSEKTWSSDSSRDRLIAELALNTGMRRDEISHLTLLQILNLHPDHAIEHGACLLPISKTKGLRARKVEVPNWLIRELRTYVDTERVEAIARLADAGVNDAKRLFVNGVSAKHNAGRSISNDTIDRAFRLAVLRSGRVIEAPRFDPETGTAYSAQAPQFTFHALRHTFAIWRYYAEYAAGIHEPWKIVQVLLGHKSLATTLAIYLRPCAVFEGQVSDAVVRHFNAIRSAA
ncbi:MAG TPA: site-specific integrase [Solimonas sp.]|nr:site-specific integrase [Solimonas sp.]